MHAQGKAIACNIQFVNDVQQKRLLQYVALRIIVVDKRMWQQQSTLVIWLLAKQPGRC